jgi:hypothetical protein
VPSKDFQARHRDDPERRTEPMDQALSAGPAAATIGERRALLREANLDVVRQIRAGCARSWATADADVQVRTFTCECGDEACEVDLDATVAAAAAGAVIARSHASN